MVLGMHLAEKTIVVLSNMPVMFLSTLERSVQMEAAGSVAFVRNTWSLLLARQSLMQSTDLLMLYGT
jgi:hypothetical protein